jgi:hypothetical protein
VTDLGDLLGLAPDPFPVARRRAARDQRRCRNCRRWVFVDRLVYGLGEECAEAAGLVVHRWKFPRTEQSGPDLLDTLEEPVPLPRRFLIRHASDRPARTLAEGVVFSDGAAVVYVPGG